MGGEGVEQVWVRVRVSEDGRVKTEVKMGGKGREEAGRTLAGSLVGRLLPRGTLTKGRDRDEGKREAGDSMRERGGLARGWMRRWDEEIIG
ncbi:hypothetical protein E2C01_060314 [Portunus trituberculatus]|uniref:Uncharacterized protein n=1 Tax=Portunus trituberculatus TaxID=210409 RepID=A0A5B7H8J3_PORTR|nr:hypothetical protein [Portunus trituberculatus]